MEDFLLVVFAIAVSLVMVAGAALTVIKFNRMPQAEQMALVEKWMLDAVRIAEEALGSKTGPFKLSKVYGMFVKAFPMLVETISSDKFDKMVDNALKEIKTMSKDNLAIYKLFFGDKGAE